MFSERSVIIYILSEATYAELLDGASPEDRLLLEKMYRAGQVIVTCLLPDGATGYIYDGPSLAHVVAT
jgi:hypothetical protein